MTHSGGKPHAVGDRGQRYQVTFFDERANKRKVFGWNDSAEGAASMATSLAKRPGWSFAQVWDRTVAGDPLIEQSPGPTPPGPRDVPGPCEHGVPRGTRCPKCVPHPSHFPTSPATEN